MELEKEEVDLYELSREIISRLAPQAAKNRVRLELTGRKCKNIQVSVRYWMK